MLSASARLLSALLAVTSAVFLPGCLGGDRHEPRRFAFLAGGSGENGAENFFVQDLRRLRRALKARGWSVNAAVGPRGGLLPGSAPALNATLMAGIHKTLRLARKDDQVLLLFHSHGRERESYWGQRSHSVVTEDLLPSGTDMGFDLDTLEPHLIEARARGVRVALVDLTCYSGGTQTLNGPACTVTLAASKYVSLCSGRPDEQLFTSYFFSLPPPGIPADLESQFLAARGMDRESVNLPQISSRDTPAGEQWENFLETVDPLDAFGDLRDLKPGTPAFEGSKLLRSVEETLERAKRTGRLTAGAASKLSAEIRSLLELSLGDRLAIEKLMPELAKDYDSNRLELRLEGRAPVSLALADLHALVAPFQSPGAAPEPGSHAQRSLAEALRGGWKKFEERHRARLQAFSKRRKEFDALADRLEKSASSLMTRERELYEFASEPYPGNSGCRDFGL